VTVSVERVGHRPLVVEVRIPPGDTVSLDVELEVRPIPLAGITARAIPPHVDPRGPRGASDRAELDLRAIDVSPGLVQSGIDDAARGVAGRSGGEPAPALLMRGSTVDQKLLLLDGSPVYAPFHLGGLLPPFDDALLSRATQFVGGAPARYDGGLSYVLDLETRAARRDGAHVSAFADLLGSGATAETPLGSRGSILGSTRFLHDLGQPLFASDVSPFGYGETLVRADFMAAPEHRVSATWFWNREDVRLDLADSPQSPIGRTGSETDLSPDAMEIVRPDAATWGNTSLSTRYRGRWGATALDAAVAASRYRAALPLGLEDPAYASARTDWIRAGAEVARPVGSWELRLGISGERIEQQTRARALITDSVSEVGARARSGAAGLYVDGSRKLSERLEFRGALRFDHFPDGGGVRIAPRVALTWSPTETAGLTLSGGRFFQLPRGAEMELGVALNDPGALSAGGALFPPAQATHLVVSLDQRLTPAVRLGVDGFVKGFRDLPGAEGRVLRSSGLDLRIRRNGDDLTGWLGYSLVWFWSPGDGASAGQGSGGDVGSGPSFDTGDFTGRHLLTAGLEGRLGYAWGGSLRASFGDGLPYTTVPVFRSETSVTSGAGVLETRDDLAGSGDDPPTHRVPTLDGFLRVDLELHREWEVSWGGRTGLLKPYLRLLNALSSRDALFHYFDPWRSPELRALADRPVLPVVGAELRF
ncbi:MAG: TonB-dependent receptor plug domain-containing protein, partial [Gemmatimonadota bacterium]